MNEPALICGQDISGKDFDVCVIDGKKDVGRFRSSRWLTKAQTRCIGGFGTWDI